MPLPLTGAVAVANGSDEFTWTGTPLTPLNCVAGAAIMVNGLGYFIAERIDTTHGRFTRLYAEANSASRPAEIEQISPDQVATATLNKHAANLFAQLSVLDANGRGLFYNLIGVTGANDPGPGRMALNHANPALVTEMYLDVLDANDGGRDVAALIGLWQRGTVLIVRSLASAAYAAFQLTVAAIDAGGYRRVQVEAVGFDGTLADEPVAVEWRISGSGLEIGAIGLFAGRGAFDSQGDGFVYASVDGDGAGVTTSVLFQRRGALAGVWSAALPFQGPKGDTGDPGPAGPYTDISFGPVTTGAAGSSASLAEVPIGVGAVRVDLTIPRGTNGTNGTGNVNGPASSTNARIAIFNGSTGKTLAEGSKTIAELEAGVATAIGSAAVRYDMGQSLSQAQRGVALFNIGVGYEVIGADAAPVSLAGLTTLDWLNLGAYHRLRLEVEGRPNTSGMPFVQISRNNGVNWDATATDYQTSMSYSLDGAASVTALNATWTALYMAVVQWHQAYGGMAMFEIGQWNKVQLSFFRTEIIGIGTGTTNNFCRYSGWHNKVAANNALRLSAPAGGWLTGKALLSGVRG